jgi:hypothetical protein
LAKIVMPVIVLPEVGLIEIVMPVIVMPEIGLPEAVMPVMVDAPVAPVLHPVEPGPLSAVQAAVGPHPGLGGVNATLLMFQAAKFSGSQLPRLHALVDTTFLSHFPPVDPGAIGSRQSREAPQDDSARQQAGDDAFSPDFHCLILRI